MTVEHSSSPESTILASPPPILDASQRGTSTDHSSQRTSPSSAHLNGTSQSAASQGPLFVRKPSPGLLARMKLLDISNKSRVVSSPTVGQDKIGRIPESQLRELDLLHRRDQNIRVSRRGRAWSGTHPRLTPQYTGASLPDHMPSHQDLDSDHSSIISTSERMVASDSEHSDHGMDILETDTSKFLLEDLEKTKSASQPASREAVEEQPIVEDRPPTPPPKDSPIRSRSSTVGAGAEESIPPSEESSYFEPYFNPYGLNRATSIYTLSRVSLSSQLSQLTSIRLPEASSLSSSISAIPSATLATRALIDAAEQIKIWIKKATEVLVGLDAEDDVEWAAAGGREGLADVDAAITRFEKLITVFVVAIEELRRREDISGVKEQDMKRVLGQMEQIVGEWEQIKRHLKGVKEQVEVAMEWEELWSTVLGEIGLELEALSRLVFEMEEKRHHSATTDVIAETGQGLDIGELETIVEETPVRSRTSTVSNRFSLPPGFPAVNSPIRSPTIQTVQEDSSLLALFARMQPLRASLDFLPMRLAVFHTRANPTFPTACEELENKRESLEQQWAKLETDADSLRRELGEDRWVNLFKQAGRKTLKMCDSIRRSYSKLKEALDEGMDDTQLPVVAKQIEAYEAKRMHYGPAIERVLDLIDRGVKDRSTVNGEVLRLQTDMRRRWTELQEDMKDLEGAVERYSNQGQQLRDSISTILTEQTGNSSLLITPGSSPASSIVAMSRQASEQGPITPQISKSRQSSFTGSVRSHTSAGSKRLSSLPTKLNGSSSIPRKTPVSRSSASERGGSISPSPVARYINSPPASSQNRRPTLKSDQGNKPRWNSSTNLNDTVIGHNFKPLTLTTPSPHRRDTRSPGSLRSVSSYSAIPRPSPLSRTPASPLSSTIVRPSSTTPGSQRSSSSLARRMPLASSPQTPLKSPTIQRLTRREPGSVNSRLTSERRRSQLSESQDMDALGESPSAKPKAARPGSSLASGRRSSLLPQPRTTRTVSATSGTGRESRTGTSGRTSSLDDRPRWRG